MATLVWLALIQDPEPLLRRLGSESAQEREQAARELLGRPDARALLERGAADSDLELAGRARDLLAAMDRRLEAYGLVLGRLRRDSASQLLRDAGQALRERCRDREWPEILRVLDAQGFRKLDSHTSQGWTMWTFLAREGELAFAPDCRFDLLLEFGTLRQTSRTEPTKEVLRSVTTSYVWKGIVALDALPRKGGEGIIGTLLDRPELRDPACPLVEGIDVEYRHLFDRWVEYSPWGFSITVRLTNKEKSLGRTLHLNVPSGLDPLTTYDGRPEPRPFASRDVLGEWTSRGRGEWKSSKHAPTILRRPDAPRFPPREDAGQVVPGPGDLQGLREDLTGLALDGEDFLDEDLAALERFAKLTQLSIGDSKKISAAGLAALARLPNLTSLALSAESTGDEHLAALAACPKLRKLSVSRAARVTDLGVAHLGRMKLTEVNLGWATLLTDEGVHELVKLKGLTSLGLWGASKLSDQALADIGTLMDLEGLTLSHSRQWTSKGFAKLGVLRKLRWLSLGYASVDDDGLSTIGTLPALEMAWLRGLSITDAGPLRLKGLPRLKYLQVEGAGVGGLEALRKALPAGFVLE